MSSATILESHKLELQFLLELKNSGTENVPHILKFVKENENGGDETRLIPIEEAIKSWSDSIADMEAGADQEQYNY